MLTNLKIRNFKRFGEVDIELGNPVVFIGPNNSGKTSAMQALSLWNIGLKKWSEKWRGKSAPEKRPGVTVNRRDLFSIPHPNANHLWRGLHTRDVRNVDGRTRTSNVRIDLIVDGITQDKVWRCGLEFDFANAESFYCRPLRLHEGKHPGRMSVPTETGALSIAFLPPMSGLAASETRLDQGAVNVRVGEGRTAEVLRNLCYSVVDTHPEKWEPLVDKIESLFGARLEDPKYVEARGEITMGYSEQGTQLDLSSSGRGLQQTLLILAYMSANPGSVILLDEPDAHLEILRQRQIYQLIVEAAQENGSQIIAASHSEVLLNEAAGKDMVVAFVGKPHRLGDRGSQLRKALGEIGFEQYSQAEQSGWVLYLEGPTDLAILKTLARHLGNERAMRALERPFVHYVRDQPTQAERHLYGLREAFPDLKGVALFDRLESEPASNPHLRHLVWQRREIENYLCTRRSLETYASRFQAGGTGITLFGQADAERRLNAMREAIDEVSRALRTLGKASPWDADLKVSDEFLTPVFQSYFDKIEIENLMLKRSFYELADCLAEDEIDAEVSEKLDAIVQVAESVESPAL